MSRGPVFWLVGTVLGFFLFAASAPSPMYVIYQSRWHFSATTLTAVFAVYAIAVLAALMAFGAVSDYLGRRPVLIVSLVAQAAGMVLFVVADGVGYLYAARLVQGVATGVATGVISAALLDLAPAQRPGLGSLVNTVALSAGLAAGAGAAGALVEYAPAPTVLTYLLLFGVFVLAIPASLTLPKSATANSRERWYQAFRPRPTGVPAAIRLPFTLASTGLVAAFALSGLYLSLAPSLAASVLHTPSHLVGGLVIFVLFAAGAAAQVALRSWPARRGVLGGSVAIVTGLAITNYALATASTPAFFAGAVVLGCGFGLALMGAFRVLASLPAPERRAEVTSAAYVVIYLSLGIPAVLAGLTSTYLGLRTTTLTFSIAIAALAVLAAAGNLVNRPTHATPAGNDATNSRRSRT